LNNEIENLQRFVANNDDMERLESILDEFNPFSVLKLSNYEIRHSNVLGWLMNPRENHRLGSVFLRKFLAEVIINNTEMNTEISVFDVCTANLDDVVIKREWKNIDLIAISEANKWILVLENKIHAKESRNQLTKYLESIKETFVGYEIVPIFLTLHQDGPGDQRYGTANYDQICNLLRFIVSIHDDNLNSRVVDFLNHYLKTLEVLTMNNDNLKKLCKKIYEDHKEALDLIFEYRNESETQFKIAANEFFNQIQPKEKSSDGRMAWFVPTEIANTTKKVGREPWGWGYPIAFWFVALRDGRLGLVMEVGPILNPELRHDFLLMINMNGIRVSERSLNKDGRYTRIFSKYIEIENWDDKENIFESMKEMYLKNAKQSLDKMVELCKQFNWLI